MENGNGYMSSSEVGKRVYWAQEEGRMGGSIAFQILTPFLDLPPL